MERVTGMGGVFFRARDPEALGRWYAEHLGVAPPPGQEGEVPWWQEAGPTVFAPFSADTDYFGSPEQGWMPNFRVRDLDAMLAQLRGMGAEVEDKVGDSDFGRPEQTWMINFRVRDLDAMLAQLRAAGADVEDKVEDVEYGRFGWVRDPEGNRIEFWEPTPDALEPPA